MVPVKLNPAQSNDFLREIWSPRPLISAGGYTRELALEVAETKGDIIGVGRLFISNVRLSTLTSPLRRRLIMTLAQPDLPLRWQKNVPAEKGSRDKYYTYESPEGYVDYPFADGSVAPDRFKRLPN